MNQQEGTKGTKKCVIKGKLKVNYYKHCLFKNEIILKSQQRFKSGAHFAYTEQINKIEQNDFDDKRLQKFARIKTYPCGTNAFKVYEKRDAKSI